MSKNETLLTKGVIHMCVKNVGRMDAYVRISAGLMMVSLGIMKHKGWMAALGSMKVAEGITRYCPVLDALNLSTLSDEELLDEALGSCVIDIEEDDDDDKTVWLMIGGFAIGTVLGIAFEKYILGLAFAIVGQGLGLILKAFDKKS